MVGVDDLVEAEEDVGVGVLVGVEVGVGSGRVTPLISTPTPLKPTPGVGAVKAIEVE